MISNNLCFFIFFVFCLIRVLLYPWIFETLCILSVSTPETWKRSCHGDKKPIGELIQNRNTLGSLHDGRSEEGKEEFTLIIVYHIFKYISRQTNLCRALLFKIQTTLYSSGRETEDGATSADVVQEPYNWRNVYTNMSRCVRRLNFRQKYRSIQKQPQSWMNRYECSN